MGWSGSRVDIAQYGLLQNGAVVVSVLVEGRAKEAQGEAILGAVGLRWQGGRFVR